MSTQKENTTKKSSKTKSVAKFLTWSKLIGLALSVICLIILFIPSTSGDTNYPGQKLPQMIDDLTGAKERQEEYKENLSDNFQALVNEGLRTSDEIFESESDYWNEYHSYKKIIKHYPVEISTLESTLLNASDEDKPRIQAKIDEMNAKLSEAQAYFEKIPNK